jgi:hypothetical protein
VQELVTVLSVLVPTMLCVFMFSDEEKETFSVSLKKKLFQSKEKVSLTLEKVSLTLEKVSLNLEKVSH